MMRFTCSTKKLTEALQTATKALSSRTTNRILEGILLDADRETLTLTCSDEQLTITTTIEASVSKMGRGVIPGKLFSEIVRRLPEDIVDIEMSDKQQFTIRSGASRTSISGMDWQLYPLRPPIDSDKEISLPQDMLRDMIQKTEFAISPEDMRKVLTGACLDIADGDVTMVGLDGFRLALRRAKCSEALEKISAIIPGRALGEIGKLLSDDENAFCTLSFAGNKLHIGLENTQIFVILVDGEYIRYRQIIPKTFAGKVEVDLDNFRRRVDRAALIARDGSNNLIMLDIHDGIMVIEANSQIGDFREEMEVEQTGEDIRIAFNVRYIMDVVRYVDCERIVMNYNNAVSPCIITPSQDTDYVHLILPVRTGAK